MTVMGGGGTSRQRGDNNRTGGPGAESNAFLTKGRQILRTSEERVTLQRACDGEHGCRERGT